MNMHRWIAALLMGLPMTTMAQSAAAPPMLMDHASMAMDHQATPDAEHAAAAARSPDYSGGIGYGSMPGMDMRDAQSLGMLRVDQLEATHDSHGDGQAWDVQGWYGNDNNKLWLRSEGERSDGRIEDGRVELLWDHALTAFWDTQLGLRQDVGAGPHRNWVTLGIQGLAPYWFELEATAYAGSSGRTAARLRVEYEWRFTQRWILQPEFELNLYGRNDPADRIGSGISDTQLGLRLRYEIRRELAPYIGVVWKHRYGATADYARADGQSPTDRQFVAGLRFWF
jgi:copper resistance protein B